jgi:hypothetical protein
VVRHRQTVNGPPVVTGPNLAIMLAGLRHMGMTYRRLAAFSSEHLGLPLSPSGALGIVNRVCDRAEPAAEEIASLLPGQHVLGLDETGWRIERERAYIWCFCNTVLAYFHPDPSRAGAVPKALLGEDFGGIGMCDFYAAYNFLPRLQRCWVHLLRDIEAERHVRPASKTLERFQTRAHELYREGKCIQALEDEVQRAKQADRFRSKVGSLSRMAVPGGRPQTLAKRIEKHLDELVTFVTEPDVEPHNNRAERQIRPLVVNRKNSYGSDTAAGAKRLCNLAGVLETCRLNGIKAGDWLRRLITGPSGTPPSPFLKPDTS